ncbi:hypothetical protein HRbin21_00173 [bacterium HR21]|jgi:hypothetical protein|nr:hypothetical protein HRbin21_00173 [bacterium HR21]
MLSYGFTGHAIRRLQQRGIPKEFIALLWYFGREERCPQALKLSLTARDYRQLLRLFTQMPAEKIPSELMQGLCLLLGYRLEEFPALHHHIGRLLRQYGKKLSKLYLVLSPDNGAIITAAYRS